MLQSTGTAEFLATLLAHKKSAGRYYSMRNLAKTLGMSPSMLCAVIKKKRSLSKEHAKKISTYSGLTGDEQKFFLVLYDIEQVTLEDSKACLKKYFNLASG